MLISDFETVCRISPQRRAVNSKESRSWRNKSHSELISWKKKFDTSETSPRESYFQLPSKLNRLTHSLWTFSPGRETKKTHSTGLIYRKRSRELSETVQTFEIGLSKYKTRFELKLSYSVAHIRYIGWAKSFFPPIFFFLFFFFSLIKKKTNFIKYIIKKITAFF